MVLLELYYYVCFSHEAQSVNIRRILIVHAFDKRFKYYAGGFIAQKYLESGRLAGLVLVNSFPPNCSKVIRRIADLKDSDELSEESLSKFGYTGIFRALLGKTKVIVAPVSVVTIQI